MRKYLALIVACLVIVGVALAARQATADTLAGRTYGLSVVSVATPARPAYAVYWSVGKGTVALERAGTDGDFQVITRTDSSAYLDTAVLAGVKYTYRIGRETASDTSSTGGGTPGISDVSVQPGAVTKDDASLIIHFKTEQLAMSQVFYGETRGYGQQTPLDGYLNQSHTVLLEHLKPNTTYHLKLQAVSATGDKAFSDDQSFTTPTPSGDLSVTEIILQALQGAFSGLGQALQFNK